MPHVPIRNKSPQENETTAMNLGISSVWRSARIRDGKRLTERLQAFEGITGIELEYRVEPETARVIARRANAGKIRIYSVHNYFPHPQVRPSVKASGDAFLLSSPDPEQRGLSVTYTKRSMEVAADLGARAVVLHLGRVEMEDPMEQIKRLYDQGKTATKARLALIQDSWKEREAKKSIYLETVLRNLSALLPLAERLNLQLGLENRYYLREIPSFEETGILLEEFHGGPVGYWHDMGHVSTQENLGIQPDSDWLAAYGKSLAGIHIHDTRGYDDHLAPGEGNTDFSPLVPFRSSPVPKILELRPEVPALSVEKGISYIKKLFNRYPFSENNRL